MATRLIKPGWLALGTVIGASSAAWHLHKSSKKNQTLPHPETGKKLDTGSFISTNVDEITYTTIPETCHGPHSSLRKQHRAKVSSEVGVVRAIQKGRLQLRRTMLEQGIPGAVVAVAKDGKVVWSEGMGFSDVESSVACTADTVMRIASISKSLAAVGCMQLCEKGLIDLDAPIQKYVPDFPKKTFEGKDVEITTRQLLAHLAGIRHYTTREDLDKEKGPPPKDWETKEFYLNTPFKSVEQSFQLFANDQLLSEPGRQFNYTTHGWTLVAAAMEKASGEPFLEYMQRHVFNPLGMNSTRGEFHEPLVYNRARHYVRNDKGLLQNTPYVDNSYKWAGGGFVSSTEDIVKFGNALLVSFQCSGDAFVNHTNSTSNDIIKASRSHLDIESCVENITNGTEFEGKRVPKPLLDPSTVALMWKPVVKDGVSDKDPFVKYALGWYVKEENCETLGGRRQPFTIGHPGGAVGATSAFVILPTGAAQNLKREQRSDPVIHSPSTVQDCSFKRSDLQAVVGHREAAPGCNGVVVAVIFNVQGVKGVYKLATDIAEAFLS